MKKLISSQNIRPLSNVARILISTIKPILPKSRPEYQDILTDNEKECIRNTTRALIAPHIVNEQTENKSLLKEYALEFMKQSTTKNKLAQSYLKLLYLFDRDIPTMTEINELMPLFEKHNKKKDPDQVFQVRLWELHVYGKLAINHVVVDNFDPVQKALDAYNSTTSIPLNEKVTHIMEAFQNAVCDTFSKEARASRWLTILDSTMSSKVISLLSRGQYKGGPIDSSLPLEQRLVRSLKHCLCTINSSVKQRDLTRMLIRKGLKQSWISDAFILSYEMLLRDILLTDSANKQLTKGLYNDLLLLKKNNMSNVSSILLELVIFPNDKKLHRSHQELQDHLPDVLYDKKYLYDVTKTDLESLNIPKVEAESKMMYCYQVGLQMIKDNNHNHSIFWFSKAIELHHTYSTETPHFLTKALSAIFFESNDLLSTMHTLNSDRNCFPLIHVNIAQSIQHKLHQHHNIDIDLSYLYTREAYVLEKNALFKVSHLTLTHNGNTYTFSNDDLFLNTDTTSLSSTHSEPSPEPKPDAIINIPLVKPYSPHYSVPSTTQSVVDEQSVSIQKKEKTKTRGVSLPKQHTTIDESPIDESPLLETESPQELLTHLKNIQPRKFYTLISNLCNFVRFEQGGRHKIAVVKNGDGDGERRIAIPNPHGKKSIPLGTARSVLKDANPSKNQWS